MFIAKQGKYDHSLQTKLIINDREINVICNNHSNHLYIFNKLAKGGNCHQSLNYILTRSILKNYSADL